MDYNEDEEGDEDGEDLYARPFESILEKLPRPLRETYQPRRQHGRGWTYGDDNGDGGFAYDDEADPSEWDGVDTSFFEGADAVFDTRQ